MIPIQQVGNRTYAVCGDCRTLVRINKPILGGLHVCVSICEARGRHGGWITRREGPFWARRSETRCTDCGMVTGDDAATE